jgi:hypothetical protein
VLFVICAVTPTTCSIGYVPLQRLWQGKYLFQSSVVAAGALHWSKSPMITWTPVRNAWIRTAGISPGLHDIQAHFNHAGHLRLVIHWDDGDGVALSGRIFLDSSLNLTENTHVTPSTLRISRLGLSFSIWFIIKDKVHSVLSSVTSITFCYFYHFLSSVLSESASYRCKVNDTGSVKINFNVQS